MQCCRQGRFFALQKKVLTSVRYAYNIKVSNDTFEALKGESNLIGDTTSRIESELEVKAYIQNLRYAINNGAKIEFQAKRHVDELRDERYTNQYTVNRLFPDENPLEAIKGELLKLTVGDYMRTVKDLRFKKEVRCASLAKYIMVMKMCISR